MKLFDRNRAIITLSIMATVSMASFSVGAKCNLPIPDGGGEDYITSKENIFGDIDKVALPFVYIKNGKSQKVEKISLSKIKEIFSVYGGDGPLTDLKPNLQVWVWYQNCQEPKGGVPKAAYFQIFSTNPKDRARLDSNGKILSVP